MTLGERICKERTTHSMSQSDLAEALEVSRQSVSKWETDASVPDLDKLVKLCGLFELSMDELVQGQKSVEVKDHQVIYVQTKNLLTPGVIVGLLFVILGTIVFLALTLLGGWQFEAFIAALPFYMCGIVCLVCKKYPGLICAWILWGVTLIFHRFYSGTSFGIIFNWAYYNGAWAKELLIRWVEMAVLPILLGVTYWLARKKWTYTR